MDFKELIEKRHSVRSYKDEFIDNEILEKLIDCAKLAPTSRNKKPCEFFIITDKILLEKLSVSKSGGSQMLKDAAAAIVVAADSEKSDVWIEDASIAMTYLHLAATDLGLGSCWIQLRNRQTAGGQNSDDYVKDLLVLRDSLKVLAILALGKIECNKK